MKNAFYAQSGGVTSVINCSAYGLISKFKKDFSTANIYASKNGIVGLLEDELYDLSKTKKPLENLLEMPGGAFGSCRFKLPDLDDEKFYKDLFDRLSKLFIGYFFYNGGNDSADTCLKVAKAAEKFGTKLVVVLGHTSCGAVKAALEDLGQENSIQSPNLKAIVDSIKPGIEDSISDLDSYDEKIQKAVRANVQTSINNLINESEILRQLRSESGLKIIGADYCLESGTVEFL